MSPEARFELKREKQPWTFADKTDCFVGIVCGLAFVVCLALGL